MLRKSLLLSLLLIASLEASSASEKSFIAHDGQYTYSIKDIKSYLKSKSINYIQFNEDSLSSASYKINENGEFQIKDWFLQDWNWLQKQSQTDVGGFNLQYGGRDFLESKINFYKGKTFDLRNHRHVKGISFPREWSGLNHPPFKNKIKDISLFYRRFTNPLVNESLFDPKLHLSIDKVSDSELTFNVTGQRNS